MICVNGTFWTVFTTLLVGFNSICSAAWWNDRPTAPQLEFGLTGDLPYDSEQEPKFNNLINDISRFEAGLLYMTVIF